MRRSTMVTFPVTVYLWTNHWEGWLPLPWPVAAGCGQETTHGPRPTQCPHVQENEAGTITNLQLRSWRPDGRTYTAEMLTSADSKTKSVANGSPVTHQTLRQQGGTGEGSYIHLADWTLSVAAIEKKKKKKPHPSCCPLDINTSNSSHYENCHCLRNLLNLNALVLTMYRIVGISMLWSWHTQTHTHNICVCVFLERLTAKAVYKARTTC